LTTHRRDAINAPTAIADGGEDVPGDFQRDFYEAYRLVNASMPPKIVDWGRGWFYLASPSYQSKKLRVSQIEAMTATLRERIARKEKA
jgi:hypothetical protein